jgi:hypothetical protein
MIFFRRPGPLSPWLLLLYICLDASPQRAVAITCSGGRYADAGATVCSDCPAGTSSDNGATVCFDCVAGEYQTMQYGAIQRLVCASCPAGKFTSVSRSTSCNQCAAGKWSNANSTTCYDVGCSAGTYARQGFSSCTQCEEGTFNSEAGRTSCDICPAGKSTEHKDNKIGATSCTDCASGKFGCTGYTGAKGCCNCRAGKFSSSAGATACDTCVEGMIPNEKSSGCNPCPKGKSAAPGDATCTECPSGQYVNDFGSCVFCPNGYFVKNTRSRLATGGAITKQECIQCPSGKFSNNETSASNGAVGNLPRRSASNEKSNANRRKSSYSGGTSSSRAPSIYDGDYSEAEIPNTCEKCPTDDEVSQPGWLGKVDPRYYDYERQCASAFDLRYLALIALIIPIAGGIAFWRMRMRQSRASSVQSRAPVRAPSAPSAPSSAHGEGEGSSESEVVRAWVHTEGPEATRAAERLEEGGLEKYSLR